MQVEFIVNGGISLLLAPDTDSEEALLKQLVKQQNQIHEIRTTVIVLNKTFKQGLLIGRKTAGRNATDDITDVTEDDNTKEETV